MHQYKGIVTRVVDGDTLVIDIDLGFGIVYEAPFRLMGIDTPEIRGETKADGYLAKDFAVRTLHGKRVVVHTFKDGKEKYGRYLAVVFYLDPMYDAVFNFNVRVVNCGFGIPDDNYTNKVANLFSSDSMEACLRS